MVDEKDNQSGKSVSPTEDKKKSSKKKSSKSGPKGTAKQTAERRQKVVDLWKRGISNVDMAKVLHVTEAQIRADKAVIATEYSKEFRDNATKMYMAKVGPPIDEVQREAMRIMKDKSVSDQVRINAMGRLLECGRQFGDMMKNAGLIAQKPDVSLVQDNRQVNIRIEVPEEFAKEHLKEIKAKTISPREKKAK